MKIEVFVSNTTSDAVPFQIAPELAETSANGALDLALQKAQHFSEAARSDDTRRVYGEALAKWSGWAELHQIAPNAPTPDAIAAYLAALAREGNSVSSINVALSAIQRACRAHGCIIDRKHPTIADTLRGIARRAAKAVDRAEALGLPTLKRLVTTLAGNDLRGRHRRR
jgi:integrase family protein with SAM-like domain